MDTPRAFEPRAHIRQLRGKGGPTDYLDARWCLAWLRDEAPDSQIETELIQASEDFALFKATVTRIVDGEVKGRATGHGSETAGDFKDYIEKAETKALRRALNALGYSVEAANLDEGGPDDEAGDEPGDEEARRALSAEAKRIGVKSAHVHALREELGLPALEAMNAEQCRVLWRRMH
jgi:hypothetical protein